MNRSCETQLISTILMILQKIWMLGNKRTDVLLLDFSKAFDRVAQSHKRLCHN